MAAVGKENGSKQLAWLKYLLYCVIKADIICYTVCRAKKEEERPVVMPYRMIQVCVWHFRLILGADFADQDVWTFTFLKFCVCLYICVCPCVQMVVLGADTFFHPFQTSKKHSELQRPIFNTGATDTRFYNTFGFKADWNERLPQMIICFFIFTLN